MHDISELSSCVRSGCKLDKLDKMEWADEALDGLWGKLIKEYLLMNVDFVREHCR